MSKASGLAFILSGLVVAAYGLSESSDLRQQIHVAKITIMEGLANPAVLASEVRPAFRPTSPSAGSGASPAEVVTLAPRSSEPPTPPQPVAIPKDRDTLARELQKELRRVGCYEGEVTGVWSPSTRRAMKAFIERMNASLPVEQPDPVLYAMVQGQRDQICGKACPIGEDLAVNGRCVPTALLAKANGKVTPPPATVAATSPKVKLAQKEEKPLAVSNGWSITNIPLAAPPSITGGPFKSVSPPVDGRMALAGPTAEPVPATAAPATRSHPTPSARTPPARAAGGGQRWSRAIFSARNSNN
jgi:peptidoglycan hydrolase-like protein with peptidoglycan-binding domain